MPTIDSRRSTFAERAILRTTTVGDAKVMGVRMQDLVRVTVACLEEDIEYLFAK